jgi:hypothetical protein
MNRLMCFVTGSLLMASALNAQAQDTKQKTTTAPVNHSPIAARTSPGQQHAPAVQQPPAGSIKTRPTPYNGPWIGTPGGQPACPPGIAKGTIVNNMPCI